MTKIKVKKIYVLFIFAIILIITIFICGRNIEKKQNKIYEQFLNGQIQVENKDGKKYLIEELFKNSDDIKYLFFDIDNDGNQELHIRDTRSYYIFKSRKDKLEIIYDGTSYEYPIAKENLIGVLYYREGGAPFHETYYFTRFQEDGKTIRESVYEWYDNDGDYRMGKEDVYFKNGEEQEKEVWKIETKVYREINRMEIQWTGIDKVDSM